MTFTETITTTFHVVACYTCGTKFAINGSMYKRAVTNKEGCVYCPACREGMHWTGKTEDQKRIDELERKLKWEAKNAAYQKHYKEQAERKLSAAKGQMTKLKKRAAAGVCPCCNRTFHNLARHMETKHPEHGK